MATMCGPSWTLLDICGCKRARRHYDRASQPPGVPVGNPGMRPGRLRCPGKLLLSLDTTQLTRNHDRHDGQLSAAEPADSYVGGPATEMASGFWERGAGQRAVAEVCSAGTGGYAGRHDGHPAGAVDRSGR